MDELIMTSHACTNEIDKKTRRVSGSYVYVDHDITCLHKENNKKTRRVSGSYEYVDHDIKWLHQ